MDVPRGRFLVAGDAWRLCGRRGPGQVRAEPQAGACLLAANLLRDVAALNNMEMLPWDVWGPCPG